MFDYSEANLDSLKNDLDRTIEECKKLVENIKSSTNINLKDFDELESTVYDVSGRVAFLGDVHPEEGIRDFGNEADSVIQNFALEIFNDDNLYKKYNEIDISDADEESIEFHKDLGIDFKNAGHGLSNESRKRLVEIDKKLIDEEVDTARKRLGTQKEVDGKIEEGDIVYLNIQEKDGKKIKEGGHSSEFSAPFDSLTKEYQKKLKGKKPGVKLDVKIFEFEENMGRESVIKYLLQIDESKEDAVVPESEVYDAEILKITRTEQAEMNQDFFDQYFGKDQVSNEDEAREKIEEVLKKYNTKQLVWAQEEPRNMGAWTHILNRLRHIPFELVARRASAATASGSPKYAATRQRLIIEEVFK